MLRMQRKQQFMYALLFLCSGEDGRLAYEQLDKFPREFVKVGGRRGTEAATAF